MAERVGFEPTVHLLGVQPISSRPRYSRFGTSPYFRNNGSGVRHKVKSIRKHVEWIDSLQGIQDLL